MATLSITEVLALAAPGSPSALCHQARLKINIGIAYFS